MLSLREFLYKLHKPPIHLLACLVFGGLPTTGFTQSVTNAYGLNVISDSYILLQTIKSNDSMKMVDLKTAIPGLLIDLRYSSRGNFMHTRLYPSSTKTTYLRKPAAAALAKAQAIFNERNLSIKIWDAYRPYSVTVKMWEPVKDDRYAADPKVGSGHNRGAAVDITLVDLKTFKELDMGTAFDSFSDTAHVGFKSLPPEILANRQILQSVMEAQGFKVLDTEWWHFYLPDAKKYPLLDLSFSQLKKLNKATHK